MTNVAELQKKVKNKFRIKLMPERGQFKVERKISFYFFVLFWLLPQNNSILKGSLKMVMVIPLLLLRRKKDIHYLK